MHWSSRKIVKQLFDTFDRVTHASRFIPLWYVAVVVGSTE